MSIKIKGNQLYMFMDSGEGLAPIACSTDCEVSFSADAIEVSATGAWKCFRAGRKSWSMNCSGLYVESGNHPTNFVGGAKAIGTKVTVAMSVLERTLVEMGIDISTVAPRAEHTLAGPAIIKNCRYTGSRNGMATYAVDFQGAGEIAPME